MTRTSPNFRDLGGIAGHAGRPLLRGRVLRGGQLADFTAADLARVTTAGVNLVVDLRTVNERAATPNPWPGPTDAADAAGRGVRTLFAPERRETSASQPGAWVQRLRDPAFDEDAARAYMLTGYRSMPQGFAPVLAGLFAHLDDEAAARPGEAALFVHCVAGKDRTGFVVAMLLWALGASHEDIMSDYLASTPYAPPRRRLADPEREVAPDSPAERERMRRASAVMAGVDRLYLEEAWAETARLHGSIERYLSEAAGLDAARRTRVREHLLVR